MTIANVVRLVDVGRIDCMPKMDVAKLAGKNTMEISVSTLIFLPCATVVRVSRTEEALKSCNMALELQSTGKRGCWGSTHTVAQCPYLLLLSAVIFYHAGELSHLFLNLI